MNNNEYSCNDDYCESAKNYQSVLSYEYLRKEHPDESFDDLKKLRENTKYSNNDEYQMATIQDDKIYIALTDDQHKQLCNGERVTANGGISGYFSDQATIDACRDGNVLDNTKYNEMCQIAPWRAEGSKGDAYYKNHIDCLHVDRDQLESIYGTRDFNAAIAKCNANNQFGQGGGNQGYNPHLNELIENKVLTYDKGDSYSNRNNLSEYNNPNQLINNTVSSEDYVAMIKDAKSRSLDCINYNSPHPSDEVVAKTGVPLNENPIESNTGHGQIINNNLSSSNYNNQGNTNKEHDPKPIGKESDATTSNDYLEPKPQNQNSTTIIDSENLDPKLDKNSDLMHNDNNTNNDYINNTFGLGNDLKME